jgi:23S rRNA pseudouridine2605 synthase
MREGKNREVKNVLGHLGLRVNRLIRVSFGPFQLGDLPEGGLEEVRTRHLREQLGERMTALAGADFTAPIIERNETRRGEEERGRDTIKSRRATPRKALSETPAKRAGRRRHDAERLGEPALARRERHARSRRHRGKKDRR